VFSVQRLTSALLEEKTHNQTVQIQRTTVKKEKKGEGKGRRG